MGGCYPFSCLMSTSKLRLETGVKYTVSSLTVVVGASPEAGGGGGKNVPTLGAGMSPRSHQIRPSQKPSLAAAAAEQQEHGFFGHLGLRLLESWSWFCGEMQMCAWNNKI